jgi:hypothetical protein
VAELANALGELVMGNAQFAENAAHHMAQRPGCFVVYRWAWARDKLVDPTVRPGFSLEGREHADAYAGRRIRPDEPLGMGLHILVETESDGTQQVLAYVEDDAKGQTTAPATASK